jgi:serine/threonine-protein kinase RsbW
MTSAAASRVLVCSSRSAVTEELVDLLRRLGAEPGVATAKSEWPDSAPDVVFLDLARGEPSVREARSAFGLDCELISLVDYESFDRLLPALAAGSGDYLFLPLNPEELGLRWHRHRSGRGGTRSYRRGLTGDLGLEFPSTVENLREAVSEVVEACERLAFSGSRATLNLRVALGEALANAILYGNRQDPEKRVRVRAELRPGEAVVTITDEGPGFDPDAVQDPTVPEHRDRSHGRGLFLLRSLADEVRFNETGNSVTLTLYG